jgi:hypothetical protein
MGSGEPAGCRGGHHQGLVDPDRRRAESRRTAHGGAWSAPDVHHRVARPKAAEAFGKPGVTASRHSWSTTSAVVTSNSSRPSRIDPDALPC